MRLKDVIDVILLVLIGVLFHAIFPGVPIAGGLKPDFTLAVLFVMILEKKDYRLIILAVLFVGVFTSLTSSFTQGPWINLIEKFITTGMVYLLFRPDIRKDKMNPQLLICLMAFIGTLISAFIFGLCSVIFVHVSVATLVSLFTRIFLPTAVLNIGVAFITFSGLQTSEQIFQQSLKQTKNQ